jgi:uncharacterized protein DUF4126
METMQTITSICLGIGLSAACGFRVFVPLLFMSIASMAGHLTLAPEFAWVATYPALITFSVATCLEIGGYYIPWLDHLLDTAATPAAIIAGTIITAAMVTHTSPMLKWCLAIIAGGGAAGLVQGSTVAARGVSTLATGGLGNPIFATIELGGAILTSTLAILTPVLAVGLLSCFLFFVGRIIVKKRRSAKTAAIEKTSGDCAVGFPSKGASAVKS